MPTILGIPLIGWVQIILGAAIVLFIVFKLLARRRWTKTGEYILRDVHIIVGDGSELYHQNVLVKDGLIAQITAQPLVKKHAQVIECSGKTLMPGLIDCHVHIQGLNNRSDADCDRFLKTEIPEIFKERILPYGVTTVKDLCAPRHFIYKLREQIRTGKITGPELLAVGPNFTAPDGHPANTLGGNNPWIRKEMAIEVSTPEQVHAGVEELKRDGVDFLKLTYQGGDYWYFDEKLQIAKMAPPLMRQVIREGSKNGLMTTAHVFYKQDVRELLEAGIYGIEHGILDESLDPGDDIIRLWKESGAHFVPTVNAMTYEKDPDRLVHSLHNLKVLYDAGIPIAMGTDNMLEMMGGEAEHRELAYYVEAGLTPMQAIVLATKNAAEHSGIAGRKGCVKPGMEADLILLDKNPVENISNIQFIDKVFLKGRVVFSQKPIQAYDIPAYCYPADVASLTYVREDRAETRKLQISRFAEEKKIEQTVSREGKAWSTETYTVEENLSAVKWRYTRPSDHTEIEAVRENDFIRLTGSFKGKAQDKRFRIGAGLWYQMMDMAMPAFIQSDREEIIFYSIGTGNNRGAMGLGEFQAKKLGEETVAVNGVSYSCNKVSFVLTMFPWAWTGLYWYDKATGQMVQSGEKKGSAEKILFRIQPDKT